MRAAIAALVTGAFLGAPLAAHAEDPGFQRSAIKDWTTPPAATAEPTFQPPVPMRSKLANGIDLLVIENHTLPIVAMQLVVKGAGAAADPEGKGGLAAFTADLLDEGAGGLSAIAISDEADRLGASLSAAAGVDLSRITAGSLAKSLDGTIDLLTKVVTQPAFDPAEVARVKGDRGTNLELRRDRPREVAQLMLDEALYGAGSPYGHASSGTKPELDRLGPSEVRAFYTERWTPAVMTLIVSGDVDVARLKVKLDATLGAWKPKGGKRVVKPSIAAQKLTARLLLADRTGAAQSDVRVGLVGLDRKDKRYYALEVLATALGGSFTSRLNNRLREQLGITYGATAGMGWRVGRGPFVISTAIVSPQTATGVGEIVKILDGFGREALPAAELVKAKQNLIRQMPAQFDTNAGTVEAFSDLVVHGLPDRWHAQYAAAVRKVTAKDVRALARAAIPSKQMVISIVGDMSVLRPELDKLNLGAARQYDLYGVPIPPAAK